MANVTFSFFDILLLLRSGQGDQQAQGRKIPFKILMDYFMKWKSVTC